MHPEMQTLKKDDQLDTLWYDWLHFEYDQKLGRCPSKSKCRGNESGLEACQSQPQCFEAI